MQTQKPKLTKAVRITPIITTVVLTLAILTPTQCANASTPTKATVGMTDEKTPDELPMQL
ncbi:hypothetical protein [Bifidobacterium pseudolongum]|uniref:Uncharacterized protein n=1 Tax=Bifidobacterium pseudolongum subsp. globosum TaxID=1690 RepID=A0A4V1Y224_9BIFI|nr:hypothetical protein [Bifidobacterium pseudolongum]RYQ16772.1 hypothetical protein PG2071B_1623 [Bifidobacterium pseudolongum subsp. globosum]